MSDLLAEVDEIMRQERMEKFWHENKTFIITFIVLTIALTGVFSGYRAWDHKVETEQTAALIQLMESSDYPANMLEADLDFRAPLRGIALMGAAGSLMTQDKQEDAYKLYQRAAQDKQIPDDLRHLAVLTTVRIDANKEGANASELLATLDPVLKNGIWQPEAQIEAAVITANLKNDYTGAENILDDVLNTEGLQQSLYTKAANLKQVYALQAMEEQAMEENANDTPSQ